VKRIAFAGVPSTSCLRGWPKFIPDKRGTLFQINVEIWRIEPVDLSLECYRIDELLSAAHPMERYWIKAHLLEVPDLRSNRARHCALF
jgi:hypothetical protein